MSADALQAGHAVNHVAREVKSIQVVKDRHIERSRRRSFLFVSADMEVVVIRAPIGQAVNQPRITVVREDDRLVDCKDRIELTVGEAVGMFG